MNPKTKTIFKAGGAISCMIVGLVCALMVFTSYNDVVTHPVDMKKWHLVVLGDIAPAAGASGIVNFSVVKHGLYTYTANFTRNASMFGYTETNNTEMSTTSAGVSNVKYGVRLDIVVKIRWNKTHAFNTTSHVWQPDWVRANITMPVFGLENFTMDEYNITGQVMHDNDFVYYQYAFGGTTSGFWINKSQRVKVCYARGWAYY